MHLFISRGCHLRPRGHVGCCFTAGQVARFCCSCATASTTTTHGAYQAEMLKQMIQICLSQQSVKLRRRWGLCQNLLSWDKCSQGNTVCLRKRSHHLLEQAARCTVASCHEAVHDEHSHPCHPCLARQDCATHTPVTFAWRDRIVPHTPSNVCYNAS